MQVAKLLIFVTTQNHVWSVYYVRIEKVLATHNLCSHKCIIKAKKHGVTIEIETVGETKS